MPLAPRLARLVEIAGKPERTLVGLMSGTSLDGLDVALCTVSGHGAETRVALRAFQTVPYAEEERVRLRGVAYQVTVPLREVCVINAWLAECHARMVLQALADWGVAPGQVDALASHGQTVYHAPHAWAEAESPGRAGSVPQRWHHATLQLGDGDHLAARTGLLTVSDFRQKEVAAGGQGAPLAPYAESLLYRGAAPRILLNLGGIANFTWLPPRGSPDLPLSGDTGPANTLIDGAMRQFSGPAGPGFDRDGAMAEQGRVHPGLLRALLSHPYFALPCPKSTGQEVFNAAFVWTAQLETATAGLAPADLIATLTRLTVDSIALTLRREVPALAGVELFISGGGQHNRSMLAWLAAALPEARLGDSGQLGVPADAKEAVLFAVLANELLCGPGFAVRSAQVGLSPAPDGQGARLTAFGKVSFPD